MRARAPSLRPSKLRLEVTRSADRAKGMSSFIARHIEQPGARHSTPAALNVRSSPSASACARTRPEPGTTIAVTPAATCLPCSTAAAARRSSIRLFVHETDEH